jgi:hypothetical protein
MKMSNVAFYAGLVSIPLSILAWFLSPNVDATQYSQIADVGMREVLIQAHSERWGLFVGLWAPTLLVLSMCLRARE